MSKVLASGRRFAHLGRLGDVITPPIPSSSPGPEDSHMEATPLPHKPAFTSNPSLPAGNPTPEPTPVEDTTSEPPSSGPRQDSGSFTRPLLGHHRKISSGTRPSLRKGYSMNQVNSKPNGTAQAHQPAFVFGPSLAQVPKPILEDFVDSPPSEKKVPCSNSTADLVGPPLPKLVYPENGSPIGPVRRLSSARGPAPRIGLGRRTLSLQGGPAFRAMRQDKRTCTEGSISPSVELHETQALSLQHFTSPEDEADDLPRISQETLLELLDGVHSNKFQETLIIDCRFEYEFEGGHVHGARNFNDKINLAEQLFESANLPALPEKSSPLLDSESEQQCPAKEPRTKVLVFHCEYSKCRAPRMAKFIRQHDRTMNQNRYPHLTYPEMYVLDGGYASFFEQHAHRCDPQAYVEMESKDHEDACERGMAKVKRRAKLSRAATYACDQSLAPQSAPVLMSASGSVAAMPMLEDSPLPAIPSAPFAKPTSHIQRDVDAMDLDEEMDDAAKRRSITFDSPSLPLSFGHAARCFGRNPSC